MTQFYIKSLFCFFILTSILSQSLAQQLPQYTQFTINPYLVNPALAGTEDFIHLQAGYRSQWSGFEDAPRTGYFSGHTALNQRAIRRNENTSRVSLGLVLTNDQTGPLEQSSGVLTFSYNFTLSENELRLSTGINAGIKQFSYNPEGFTDGILNQDDPTIQQVDSRRSLNLSAGIWLYNEYFFAGASSFQLFNTDLVASYQPGQLFSDSPFLRHYYFMAGLKMFQNDNSYLVPSFLLKKVAGTPLSYDINMKIVLSDQYWMGANYRKGDSFALFAGLLIGEKFELSYSFDLVLSQLKNAAAGSNEIHLGYRLFYSQNPDCPSKFW